MTRYMLTTHADPDVAAEGPPPTDEQMQEWMGAITDLEDEMAQAGAWVFSVRLGPPAAARVVRTTEGDTAVTDGPYLDTKEQAAGFYVIETEDEHEAMDWARRVASCIGRPIELRQLDDWSDVPMSARSER